MKKIGFVLLIAGIGCASLGNNGCSGPNVTVYTSAPNFGGMEWANATSGLKGFIPYSSTDKFTCFTPDDLQTILNYCRSSQNPNGNASGNN